MSAPPVKGFAGGEVYKPAPLPRSAAQKRLQHAMGTGHVTEIEQSGRHVCTEPGCGAVFVDDPQPRGQR